ncbi:MAG: hypothetical protein EPO40_00915 [Myxococcaceae bacterium]|nr:MAG: hypothetical protein EPO40_00915 [Myxococcaceae bacterium]
MKAAAVLPGLVFLGLLAEGCASAGRYGYARTYVPLDEEATMASRAEEPVYDEIRRAPEPYRGRLVSFFGVVRSVERGEGGGWRLALQVRTHQERHLCEEDSESTCRVTVSARDGGPFTAVVTLRPEDLDGENRLQTNSLVRVFGTVTPGEYDAEGGPVVQVQYYRHWPRGQYVTTASADSMRR